MNIDSAIKVISAFSNLASAANNIDNIVDSITGSGGTARIVDAIDQLDADVRTGFADVVSALGDQTLVKEWTPISKSLTYIYNASTQYLTVLQSLTKASSGPNSGSYVVIVQTQETLFTDWCQASGGPLTTLASFVETANYGGTPGMLSLAGMFTNLESSNTALDLWVQIAQAAQASPNQVLAKYKGQTVFDLVNKLMSEVFTILGMVYYAHDAALKALNQLSPNNGYSSLAADINTNFGNTGTAGTVWNAFAAELKKLRTTPVGYSGNGCNPLNPQGQVLNASLTGDQYPGPAGDYTDVNGWIYTFALVETTAPPNSFFTSLQIAQVPCNGCNQAILAFVLQGVPATVGKNLSLSSDGVPIPDPNGSGVQSGWYWNSNDGLTEYNPGFQCPQYAQLLYSNVTPPQTASNNVISVVTGFAFAQSGNRLGIALQFGELDVSDPENPTVTVTNPAFQQPVWPDGNTGYIGQSNYIDGRPAGDYKLDDNGSPVNRLGIMTNASLITTYGNRWGLNVQMAAPLYKADFFQPDNLPSPIGT